jgi:hypothetical protein
MRFLNVLVFLLLLFLLGCSQNVEKNKTTEENLSTIEVNEEKIMKENIEIKEDSLAAENFKEDIDGDGDLEDIILYISPAPKPHPEIEGKYLWDSNHLWQLIVKDGEAIYPLHNKPVQGSADVFVVSSKNEKEIVFLEHGTVLSLTTYKYNSDEFYEKKIIYYDGPILHRSVIN